jgi:hypothetical protein
VRCPECAADVPVLREFCPNCGAAMDPGIRGSLLRGRGGRPSDGAKGGGKAVLIGGAAAILLALGAAGTLSWPSPTISVDSGDRDQPGGPVTIEAAELHQAYRDDWDAAARRFAGREMVVSGEFLRIVPDGYGSLDLRLKTSDPEEQLGIDVAQLAIEDAKQLRPGQRVTVSCQQMGSGGDELWVQDCAIQLGGEVDLPPSPPSPPADPPSPPSPPAEGQQ